MRDGLCLDEPKKAENLEICPDLEGKEICCDAATLNKIKKEFEEFI